MKSYPFFTLSPRYAQQWLALAAIVLCFLFLAGCGVLNPGPAPTRMQLHPDLPPAVSHASKTLGQQLSVARPTANTAFDNDSVILQMNNRELRQLAGVRWESPITHLVQNAAIDALQASQAFKSVSDEGTGVSANAKLLTDIRQFALAYPAENTTPEAIFQAVFQVLDLSNGRVKGTLPVKITVPAQGRENSDLVKACETALSQALAQVTPWVVSTVAAKETTPK